jgi:hypothetical protein
MKLSYQLYKIILPALIFFGSCYYYTPVRILKPVNLNTPVENPEKKADIDARILESRERIESFRVENKAQKKFIYKVYLKKYFAFSCSLSPAAKINNRGVNLALAGGFEEAQVLFVEALKEDNNMSAAINNLGIIYDISGLKTEASNCFSRACCLEPENEYFRNNFLYLNANAKKN